MGSLLAHELARSLVARRNGVQVEGITLWLFADDQLAGIVAPADISRALERISGNRGPFGSAGRWRRP